MTCTWNRNTSTCIVPMPANLKASPLASAVGICWNFGAWQTILFATWGRPYHNYYQHLFCDVWGLVLFLTLSQSESTISSHPVYFFTPTTSRATRWLPSVEYCESIIIVLWNALHLTQLHVTICSWEITPLQPRLNGKSSEPFPKKHGTPTEEEQRFLDFIYMESDFAVLPVQK